MSLDAVYDLLGIAKAREIAGVIPDEMSSSERGELIRLVVGLALSRLPPVYPADQKYVELIEELELPTSVSDLRSRLGFTHFHTRDSILAALRGFLFSAMLQHFDSFIQQDSAETSFAESFLSRVAAGQLSEWIGRIERVLAYSRYEDWDDATATSFARAVIEDILSWFIREPGEFMKLPRSPDAWRKFLWSSGVSSYRTRFFAGVFHHLRILRESELGRPPKGSANAGEPLETVDGGAGGIQSSRSLLVESSWYRHFFFDERGIARWVKYGSVGFEKEESFDDFVSKLERRAEWRTLTLPTGKSIQNVDQVRERRLLGRYRVVLKSGEIQDVLVKPIPTVGFDELLELSRRPPPFQGSLALGKRLWLFCISAPIGPGPGEFVVRSIGHDWSGLVQPYQLEEILVGVVRVPRPGRYAVSLPNSSDAILEIAETRDAAWVEEPIYDLTEGMIVVGATADATLENMPSAEDLQVVLRHPGGEVLSRLSVHLTESSVNLYRLEARFEVPLSASVLGRRLVITGSLLKEALSLDIPEIAILQRTPVGCIRVPGATTVSITATDELVILVKPPFDVQLADGSALAKITDGFVGNLATDGSRVDVVNHHVTSDLTITDRNGSFLRELTIRSGTRLIRIIRRREIRLQVNPSLVGEGKKWMAYAGRPLSLSADVVPSTRETVRVSLVRSSGAFEAFEVTSGSSFPIPDQFLTEGATIVRADCRDTATLEVELTCVGGVQTETPPFLEAGQFDVVARLRCTSDFFIKWMTGNLSRWTSQPRLRRPTKEVLVLGVPYRTPDAVCRLNFESAYSGRSIPEAVTNTTVQVPLVWIEVRHRGEKVDRQGIQNYMGESVTAVLRSVDQGVTARAEFQGLSVGLSHAGSHPTNLTQAFRLREHADPIVIEFFVKVENRDERKLTYRLEISPRYVPRVSIPDGPAWHPDLDYAVVLEDHQDGMQIKTADESGVIIGTSNLVNGLGVVSLARLPARLLFVGGHGESLHVEYGGERESIPITASDRPVGTSVLTPTDSAGLQELFRSDDTEISWEKVSPLFRQHNVLCIEFASLLSAIPLVTQAATAGWAIRCSDSTERVLGDLAVRPVTQADDRQDGDHGRDSIGLVLLLDNEDAPTWESFLLMKPEGRALVVAPAGTFAIRATLATAVQSLGVSLKLGRLTRPHDMTAWGTAVTPVEASALAQEAMQVGVEDVMIAGTIAILKQSDASLFLDSAACENLGQLIGYPGLLSRLTQDRQLALRAAIKALTQELLVSKLDSFEAAGKGLEGLLHGWDYGVLPDPRKDLFSEQRQKIFEMAYEQGNWVDAIGLLRRVSPIFEHDVRFRWELPAMIIDAHGHGAASDNDFFDAVLTLVRLKASGLGGCEASVYRDLITQVLRPPRCQECGGIILRTTSCCARCGRLYPDAFEDLSKA